MLTEELWACPYELYPELRAEVRSREQNSFLRYALAPKTTSRYLGVSDKEGRWAKVRIGGASQQLCDHAELFTFQTYLTDWRLVEKALVTTFCQLHLEQPEV